MPLVVQCQACGQRHQAADEIAGTMARCHCGAAIQIPALPEWIICECPGCGRRHTADASMAGSRARCACGTVVLIPGPQSRSQGHAATDDFWSELAPDNPPAPVPTSYARSPAPTSVPSKKKVKAPDIDAIRKNGAWAFGIVAAAGGLLMVLVGASQLDSVQGEQLLGYGIAGIICGGAILIFLAAGGRVG